VPSVAVPATVKLITVGNPLVAVMLTGSAMLTRAVLPGMRRRGFGRIVNVGSIHSLVASPYKSAYVAAKHGIAGLTKTAALEMAEKGVTVNAVAPGYMKTRMIEEAMASDAERILGRIPLGRIADPAEVAAADHGPQHDETGRDADQADNDVERCERGKG